MAVARNQRKTENTAKCCKCVCVKCVKRAHTQLHIYNLFTYIYIYIILNKYFSWFRNEAGKLRLQTALRSLSESGSKYIHL